jgi:hypothetical protein
MHVAPRRAWIRPVLLFALLFSLLLAGVLAWYFKPGTDDSAVAAGADGPLWFKDVTEASGLDFVHDAGPTDTFFMPQSMGSGAAVIHDGDGTLYVYLLHQGGPSGKKNQLFKQLPDGTYKDVSAGSGLDIRLEHGRGRRRRQQ